MEKWKQEARISNNFLVTHREGSGHAAWRSCCIHGISVDKTGHWQRYTEKETNICYDWTELSTLTPTITNFWKCFPTETFAFMVVPHRPSAN